jgi:GABA(A) receptor-associated protein
MEVPTFANQVCKSIQEIDWDYLKEQTSYIFNTTTTLTTETVRAAYAAVVPPSNFKRPRFIESLDVKTRRAISNELLKDHPHYVPVIVEKDLLSRLPEISKRKYLIHTNLTMGNLLFRIRAQISDLQPHEALFFFTSSGNHVSPPGILVSEFYHREKSKEDGFLYLVYREENVFG